MRFFFSVLVSMVVLVALCIMPVAADSCSATTIDVKTVEQDVISVTKAPPIYGEVRQGEVDPHQYYVPSGHSTLEVSLQWDHTTNNDLSLTMYPPNGNPLAWNDASDGQTNGEISLNTPLPSQMTGKHWNFVVTGARVSGTQSYTLVINSY
ncbi:hypothetical protein [Methanorbis rubei]|uniref:Uncharacterized protein n=1 Tax=Methanorbis rubei TaxID=3028300 RepID=A0AAE4MFI2_9EURY|nr:hypothetical protein [Methanocorpusculaceae archaeon Cs1]